MALSAKFACLCLLTTGLFSLLGCKSTSGGESGLAGAHDGVTYYYVQGKFSGEEKSVDPHNQPLAVQLFAILPQDPGGIQGVHHAVRDDSSFILCTKKSDEADVQCKYSIYALAESEDDKKFETAPTTPSLSNKLVQMVRQASDNGSVQDSKMILKDKDGRSINCDVTPDGIASCKFDFKD